MDVKETSLSPSSSIQSSLSTTPRESLSSSKRRSSLGNLDPRASADNVRVVCRVRPQNKIEKSRGGKVCVTCDQNRICVDSSGRKNKFNFDALFSPETKNDQSDVFEACGQPMVEQLFKGFNATIFAYGQTSSGKTHTMMGPSLEKKEDRGIIPRVCYSIFQRIYDSDDSTEFTVKVSYVEIYMERLRDLLDPSRKRLAIRESKQKGIYVENMTEFYVQSPDEMFDLMNSGMANRATSATGMNEGSSRSHSVFIVEVNQKDTKTGSSKQSRLFLVDLAGSEMVRKTNASGDTLEEAKQINKSLSALGLVIKALTDGKPHIPYRNSKLTRMLQESLGGNAKTCLIICCSPSSYNSSETMSTCSFGKRAKRIKNRARINQQLSAEELQKRLRRAKKIIGAQTQRIRSLEDLLRLNNISFDEDNDIARGPSALNEDFLFRDEESTSSSSTRFSDVSTVGGDFVRQLREARDDLQEKAEEVESLSRILEEREEQDNKWRKNRVVLREKMKEERVLLNKTLNATRIFTRRVCDALKRDDILRDVNDILGENEMKKEEEDEERQEDEIPKRMSFDATAVKEFQDKLIFEISENVLVNDRLKKVNEELTKELDSTQQNMVNQTKLDDSTRKLQEASKQRDEALSDAKEKEQKIAELGEKLKFNQKEIHDKEKYIAELKLTVNHAETRESEVIKRLEKSLEDLRKEIHDERESALHKHTELQRSNDRLEREKKKLESKISETQSDLEMSLKKSKMLEAMDAPMNKKERQKYKDASKKLHQLVSVHRKLLRKFATLELEIAEARHKLALRDERIRQLESQARKHASDMHVQAEIHANELKSLRLGHKEALKNAQRRSATLRKFPSGAQSIVKPIRGKGGKLKHHDSDSSDGSAVHVWPSSPVFPSHAEDVVGDEESDDSSVNSNVDASNNNQPGFFARMWAGTESSKDEDVF